MKITLVLVHYIQIFIDEQSVDVGFYSEGDFRSHKLKVYTTQYRLFGLQDLNQTYDQSQIHLSKDN
jgi:hypothetical protein